MSFGCNERLYSFSMAVGIYECSKFNWVEVFLSAVAGPFCYFGVDAGGALFEHAGIVEVEVVLCDFLFSVGIRDEIGDAVHLEDIPRDDIGDMVEALCVYLGLDVMLLAEVVVILNEGDKDIFSCDEEVVTLVFEGIDTTECLVGIFTPVCEVFCVFANDPEFAIKQSDTFV